MATGFVTRWKGKIAVAASFFGGVQTFGPGSTFTGTTTGSTNTDGGDSIINLAASSAKFAWALGIAPQPGLEVLITFSTVSSGAQVKTQAGSFFTPSSATVLTSTYEQQITLRGVTTSAWRIQSVWPPPSTLVGGSGITLTTTT